MVKNLSKKLKVGVLSLLFVSSLGTSVFANDEKVIPKGIGETEIISEARASGTLSDPYIS